MAAMPVYIAKHCMKFIFRGFSEEMPHFAANVLGARGALLSVLVHFFEHAYGGIHPWKRVAEEQSLTADDQVFILAAGGDISNRHARNGSTGGANLLRARGVVVSFGQSSSAPVFGTDGSSGAIP